MTQEQMLERLKLAFPDSRVMVTDLTGGQNHWAVEIESKTLGELTRIRQHQTVMSVFGEELKTGEVHALTLKVTG